MVFLRGGSYVDIYSPLPGITCVYFTEKRPVVCLNSASNVGSVLGRVFAHSNTGDNCTSGELSYDIDEETGSIAVNNTGWLTLTKQISGSFTGIIKLPRKDQELVQVEDKKVERQLQIKYIK